MPTVQVLQDTFDEASIVSIASHTPNVGGAWSFVEVVSGAGPSGSMFVGASGHAYCTGGAAGVVNAVSIGSNEWDAFARFERVSSSFFPMQRMIIGCDASGVGGVSLLIHSFNDELQLRGPSTAFSGVGPVLQFVSHTQPSGSTKYAMRRRNSGADALIQVYINDVEVTGLAHTLTGGASAPTTGRVFFQNDGTSASEGRVLEIDVTAEIAADTTAPNITSTGTGSTNGPFGVNVAENSTAVAVTLTSDEALSSVTKGGADGALFTLAGSGLTRTLAPTAAFNFESLPHANPFVVTLTFADTATPTPNERTVTVNFTVTDVSEPPLAPTIGTAVAGNAQATVNGTAPVNTGRPAITGYRSTATPGGSTVTGASLPITHTGLTNGVAHTFTLAAQNADGFGPESAASNSITPSAGGTAPMITVQPSNQTVTAGATATFSVTATGSGTLTYQWRRNGTSIGGATSASYTTPVTTVSGGSANNGDVYSVVVTGDTSPAATSSNATLTVNAPGATYGFFVGPFGLNSGSGPVLGVPVSYTLTPGEVGAASGASINGTGTFHATTGVLTVSGLAAPGLYSVQIKNADGTGRWHDVKTAV
jgi:large repetitive protein